MKPFLTPARRIWECVTLLLICAISNSVKAQEYALLRLNTPIFFESEYENIMAVGVDSVDFEFGNLIYHLTDSRHPSGQDHSTRLYTQKSESFLGNKMRIDKNGHTILSSYYDTETYNICHSCREGEEWTVSHKPLVKAMVTSISLDTVNGQLDSVKTITFSNKKELKIAKFNSVVKSPLFFPPREFDSNMDILRHEEPRLTYRDVYDMEIGDEFQWNVRQNKPKSPHEIHILKVLSKDVKDDSVRYLVRRYKSARDYFVHDTVSWHYPYKNEPISSSLPGQRFTTDSTDSRVKFSYVYNYLHSQPRGKWSRLALEYEYYKEPNDQKNYYVKGCGLYFSGDVKGLDYYRQLRYYKKGQETWGSGITVNVPYISPAKLSNPLIYPSLANHIIFISDESEYGPATLHGLNGSVEHIDLSNGKYDTNHLAEGVYFIRFKSGRKEKFIVTR